MDNPQNDPNQPRDTIRNQYRQPDGALPMEKMKRLGGVAGVVLLIFFIIWNGCHRESQQVKKPGAVTIQPTGPDAIASQEEDLKRQMAEADRARQMAEEAKRRAMMAMDNGQSLHPQPANGRQADPEDQMRKQLRAERYRKEWNSAYSSSLVYSAAKAEQKTAGAAPAVPVPTQTVAAPFPEPKPVPTQTAQAKSETDPTDRYSFDSADGPNHRLFEGTIIETVLVNRLDGTFSGPVITQVSADVYDHDLNELLIPKGSRVLGEAKRVQTSFDERLAVFFHRIIMPDGFSVGLDKFQGLDQIGETGLRDKISRHYLSIFGTSLAIGAIGGLAQVGSYGGGSNGRFYGFQIGVSERMAESAQQVMQHMLNRLPTITIREGQRVKIFLSNDLLMPAYSDHTMQKGI